MIRVRGGTPNGVMKLPGRVMAGGVVPAGVFFCFFVCVAASGSHLDPRPTRDNDFSRTKVTEGLFNVFFVAVNAVSRRFAA